jgi:predicted transposase/invertase (TIGR01784 family)
MKTDKLFYEIFLNFPEIFFDLIQENQQEASYYQFTSQEIKQLSFRLDGLFLPINNDPNRPFYLVEVQFQVDEDFYYRLFSELFIYLKQYKPLSPWQIVVIYPSRPTEREHPQHFQDMLSLERVRRIYLDELNPSEPPSLSLGILKLILENEMQAVNYAKLLINQATQEIPDQLTQKNLIDLIETIIIYKLPKKSRQEIQTMLNLQDLKQTKFYQEAFEEGIEEGVQRGIEEGRQSQKLDIIPLLKELGLTPQQIAERLELDLQTVTQYLEPQGEN